MASHIVHSIRDLPKAEVHLDIVTSRVMYIGCHMQQLTATLQSYSSDEPGCLWKTARARPLEQDTLRPKLYTESRMLRRAEVDVY